MATAATWYGARLTPFQVDHKVAGEQEDLALGGRTVRALHTPGHSPGSLVYLTESENLKVLFAQDVHGPLHPDLQSNQEDYRRSLEFLLTLEADILCEGHYGVYQGKKKVAEFIRRFL